MTRLLVGPFNRVEGDLEVQLEVTDGRVQSAQVNATMYRGFEHMLRGKDPHDALVYVPRICGICSVSQSVAAAHALADASGVAMPPNGRHALNLMLATENLADHLTHFYLFFMPDFAREVYAQRPWFAQAQRRFAALQGEHARMATAARQRWFTILGTLGGKWPHTQSVLPGGSARPVDMAERIRLLGKVRELRAFLESTQFSAPLEELAAIQSEADLQAWHARSDQGDLRLFLTIAAELKLDQMGIGPGRYLSYGAYVQPNGGHALAAGLWRASLHSPLSLGDTSQSLSPSGDSTLQAHAPADAGGSLQALDLQTITEDATHAWLHDTGGARHPSHGLTQPDADKAQAYTWNKAPRLAGEVVETGAIARQLTSAQPLISDAVARCGGNVYTRVLARLIELARVLPLMEHWLLALRPGEPWHHSAALPERAQAVGLTEAARGALGHWLHIEHGRIANYQIIAPTTWNFSPRDAQGTPGALEQALVGTPIEPGEATPVAVQHVVRSFDPCMVCTVH
jgi:Ni,Fe-hydrogenase I large subunit